MFRPETGDSTCKQKPKNIRARGRGSGVCDAKAEAEFRAGAHRKNTQVKNLQLGFGDLHPAQ